MKNRPFCFQVTVAWAEDPLNPQIGHDFNLNQRLNTINIKRLFVRTC